MALSPRAFSWSRARSWHQRHGFYSRMASGKSAGEVCGGARYGKVGRNPRSIAPFFLVRMDKSTCQSYNLRDGIFGFRGTPTKRTIKLLEKIQGSYGVCIMAVVQATHTVAMLCTILVRNGECVNSNRPFVKHISSAIFALQQRT